MLVNDYISSACYISNYIIATSIPADEILIDNKQVPDA